MAFIQYNGKKMYCIETFKKLSNQIVLYVNINTNVSLLSCLHSFLKYI